jgi:hypothetical protein
VQYRIDLLSLRDDVQHLVGRGQIASGPAWYISRLSQPGQAEVLAKLNNGEFLNDDAICRYAAAVRMREESPGMFDDLRMGETDELAAERRRVRRNKIQSAWTKIEGLGSAFGPFLELSPEELAAAVGADTPLYHLRVETLAKTVRRTQALLRQALAIHNAKGAAEPVERGFPERPTSRRIAAEDNEGAA